ncbi:hypothetical protein SB18R_09000 [Pseudomonas oryzihabitans]|nr:hypothetical protein SB9_15155 [Pseudomonas psychrotolerans]KTT77059.1 hypothetical protein SB18R_09000 [Pseudomonas psychrotolerans]
MTPQARTLVLEGLISLIEADSKVKSAELELLGLFCTVLELPFLLIEDKVPPTDDLISPKGNLLAISG